MVRRLINVSLQTARARSNRFHLNLEYRILKNENFSKLFVFSNLNAFKIGGWLGALERLLCRKGFAVSPESALLVGQAGALFCTVCTIHLLPFPRNFVLHSFGGSNPQSHQFIIIKFYYSSKMVFLCIYTKVTKRS